MKKPCRFRFFKGAEAQHIAFWVAEKVGVAGRGFGKSAALGVFHNDALTAGLIFHDYQPQWGTIEVSAAGKGWATRPIMAAIVDYVFTQAGCRLLILRTSEHNKAVNRIARSLGFRGTAVPQLRGPDEAEILWTLDKATALSSRYARVS